MVISLSSLFALGKIEFFLKTYLFWIIGFFIIFLSYFINYRVIFDNPFFYFIIIFSLVILIIPLFSTAKIKSWLTIGKFNFQPSELSKIGLFLILDKFLNYYQYDLINPVYLFLSSIFLIPYIFLIFLQPDLGMILVYFLTWLLVIINFISRKEIFYGFLILVLIFIFLWFFVLKDYQKDRILVLLNPNYDPFKSGYNLRQIRLSLATAGFFGKGNGLGEIGRLGLLPSAHTDFILTFLIEEKGIFIFLIYSFLFFLLLREINKSQDFQKDPEIKNFIYIVKNYFLVKWSITTLVNFGLFPLVGLPVPFLSYGGSHLIFDLWLISIILNLTKVS